MRKPRMLGWAAALGLPVAFVSAGCGGSIPVGEGGAGGAGGAGGTGGGPTCGGADTSGCNVVVEPSADDTQALQTALIEVQSGQTVCLCPGTYKPKAELSLTVTDVTVKGVGATRDDVVIDFAEQMSGDDGILVTSDGFTIENLSVKNSPGNGVVVNQGDDVVFRNLKVSWDAGSVTTNGAYAVYPVGSTGVLVEGCEVVGASDAGIYVGQSEQVIVRNNDVHGNVAGIEIENSNFAEVYGNRAYDNTAGILVFVLPNLEQKDGTFCNIHDNEVFENNRENFGDPNTTVGAVPAGMGVLVFAADDTEIHDNIIRDNNSIGITVVSYPTFMQLDASFMPNDPMTDGYAERTYIYDNTFMNNGQMPALVLLALGHPTLFDVLTDGEEKTPGGLELCLGTTPPTYTFMTTNGSANLTDVMQHSTDPTPFLCEHPVQPPVMLP